MQRESVSALGERRPLPTKLLPWAIAGAGLALFAAFPVAYSEGDSTEFDSRIPIGAIWRERELLDFYFKAKLWGVLRGWFPRPSQIYVLVATVAGAVYLAGAWLVARVLGRTTNERLIVVAALAAVGNILLFFGYIESYALVNVASLFVLWACWEYSSGKIPFGTVGALATLAALLHGSALWWGPMVVVAWLVRAFRLPAAERWRAALREGAEGVGVGLAMCLVMLSIMILDGYDYERLETGLAEMGGRDARTLLPLFQAVSPYEHYTFVSWPHWGAVAQEQLLTAPMALLTISVVSIWAWKGVRRLASRVPGLITLAAGAASMFFYSVSWNPDLGPRSDWDLLALPALPLTLLAIFLLLRLPTGRWRRLAIAAYLSVSAVHAASWVALHYLNIRY